MASLDDIQNILLRLGAWQNTSYAEALRNIDNLRFQFGPNAFKDMANAVFGIEGKVANTGAPIGTKLDNISTLLQHVSDGIDTINNDLNTGDIHNRLQAMQDRLDALEPIIARIGLPDNLDAEGTGTLFGLIESSLRA